MNTAFIGLGVMGYPMAGHMVNHAHRVCVYNRTRSKAEAWMADYGTIHSDNPPPQPTPPPPTTASTPSAAAEGAEVVCLCVGNDADIRAVVYGDDGVLAGMKPDSVLIDHTTASATLARELESACDERKVGFVDAPVSGGQSGARQGTLTIMAGGRQEAYDKAAPIFDCYGRMHHLLGGAGSGQLAKMVNQTCIAGLIQGLSEAIAFGQKAGLDMKAVMEVLGKGAAASWQMENRADTMIDDAFDFGFAVDWMRKDLGIVLEEANRIGAGMPVTALIDQFYADVQRDGGGRMDTSSLITRLRSKQ